MANMKENDGKKPLSSKERELMRNERIRNWSYRSTHIWDWPRLQFFSVFQEKSKDGNPSRSLGVSEELHYARCIICSCVFEQIPWEITKVGAINRRTPQRRTSCRYKRQQPSSSNEQIPTTIGQYESTATADASIRYTMWNRDGIRSYQAFPTADQKMS